MSIYLSISAFSAYLIHLELLCLLDVRVLLLEAGGGRHADGGLHSEVGLGHSLASLQKIVICLPTHLLLL